MSAAILLHSDDSGRSLLTSMGLQAEAIDDALRRALAQYKNTTPFHAPNAPGTLFYHEMIPALRQVFVPQGWEYSDKNLSLIFHREMRIAIAVASGDDYVGDPRRQPSFRYSRGPATTQAVSVNSFVQGKLFDLPGSEAASAGSESSEDDFSTFSTWWLLHYIIPTKELRAELSLPLSVYGGMIDQFDTRIILDTVPFDTDAEYFASSLAQEAPVFDVPVRKKA